MWSAKSAEKLFPCPLALVGPSSDTRIHTKGYAFIGDPQQQQNPGTAKQIETYELQRVGRSEFEGAEGASESVSSSSDSSELHWKGTYTMVQEPVEHPGQSGSNSNQMPTLRVLFDFEMTIDSIPQSA